MKRQDVRDWVVKAEEDDEIARTLIRKRPSSFNNGIAFHAQQYAEKYLKAFLVSHRIAFPKTHDLLQLLKLAARLDTTLELLQPFVATLIPYAVDFRYPGEEATRAEARRALEHMRHVRDRLRQVLKLKP